MENKEKLKYYNYFEKQLRNITNYFYYRYKKILNLEWNEFKQEVDLQFFKNFEKNIEENVIIEDRLFTIIRDNVKDIIKTNYFRNKKGKLVSYKTISLETLHEYQDGVNPLKNNVAEKLLVDIDYYFQEETYQVIKRYKKELNLSDQEEKFLFDWSDVNYNKEKLFRNKNNKYTEWLVNNLQKHIKNKLLRKELI